MVFARFPLLVAVCLVIICHVVDNITPSPPQKTMQDKAESPLHPSNAGNDADNNNADDDAADNDADDNSDDVAATQTTT
jgi:hypothetical protein